MPDLHSLISFMGAAESSAEHAADEAQGLAALGIDPLAILAQAGTFLVLFLVLRKYALGPIVASLEKRRKTIDDGVRLGLEMEKKNAHLDGEVDKIIARARTEADKIIAASHQEATDIVKSAEESAEHKAAAILDDAKSRIDEEIKKAKSGLEKEIVGLVAEATEAVIGEKMSADKDLQLIRRSLQGVER